MRDIEQEAAKKRSYPLVSSSGSSGCLGAEAQQTDKASAVSDRLGDGPAWLAEFETLLDRQHRQNVEQHQISGSSLDYGYLMGVLYAAALFRRLKRQGQAKATQPESHDGQ